jgi:hypothetical protein
VPKAAQVFLEPPDHDRLQLLGCDVDASRKALRVQDFEERSERVGVTVVWGGGKEKPMFEKRGDFAHRPRHLAFQGPCGSRGRRCVMRLVQNEHRSGPERREVVAETAHVCFFG